MGAFTQDVVHALRLASKRPGFAVAVVATLALGIGANTAVFEIIDTVLMRPLPYKQPERLFALFERDSVDTSLRVASYPTALDWREQSDVFDGVAFARGSPMAFQTLDQTGLVIGAFVSEDFFPLLGVPALIGRGLQVADYTTETNHVAVLAHRAWQNWFGADSSVAGNVFRTEGGTFTIVGVMPPEFVYPNWGAIDTDMWLPIPAMSAQELAALQQREFHADSWVIARLRAEVPLPTATAQMNTIADRLAVAYPSSGSWTRVELTPLRSFLVRDVRTRLLLLGGAVAFVLLIGCANLANLYLAHGAARRREFAVRAALGASRWRVAQQLVTESMVLAIAGGLLGSWIATVAIAVIKTTNAFSLPRITELRTGPSALAFAAVLTALTAIVFSTISAKQAASSKATKFLNNRDGSGAKGSRLPDGVLAAQLGLTFVLLIGAALLVESFVRISTVDPGFDANNLAVVPIIPPSPRYDSPNDAIDLYNRVKESLGAVPGVEGVALVNHVPPSRAGARTSAAFGQAPTGASESLRVVFRTVSAGYFSTMGIPVIAGREFSNEDLTGPPGPLIVNQFLARMWAGENSVGQRMGVLRAASTRPDFGEPLVGTIVGIVGNIGDFGADPEQQPYVYVPFTHNPWASMRVVVRTNIAPQQIIPSMVQAVRQVDPAIPLGGRFADVRVVETARFGITSRQRFNAILLTAFAIAALTLATIGVYGVMAYTVTLETKLIGIRIALGATPSRIARSTVMRVARIALIGLTGGVVTALALTRFIVGMLYEVEPIKPEMFAGVGFMLISVIVMAAYVPARRASTVDPTIALRSE